MRLTRPRLALAGLAVFVVVAVGFVLAMRGCAKAIWPEQFAHVDPDFNTIREAARIHRNGVAR